MLLANASALSSALDYFEANASNASMDYGGIFDSSKMSVWEIIVTIVCLVSIIIFTVVGNILVILSVCTYTPLRTAQNFFIVSLAVADLTVAFLVLPFNVAYITMGRWVFGVYMCQMWLTCDILCCTASILNLSAIALDRYWAITDPINYANKRTLNLVLSMITGVWVLSFVICLPPLVGWNDWPDEYSDKEPCQLTEKKGFVIFSSLGSFFIPLVLMLIVYVEIFRAIRRRSRERAKQSKINQMSGKVKIKHPEDSVASDNGQNGVADNHKQKLVKHKRSRSRLVVTVPSTDHPTSLAPAAGPTDESTSENDRQAKEPPQMLCPQTLPPELKTTDVIVKIAPGGANQIYQFIEERQKISLSKERRAARTLGIIVGVFIVCWLPFFLMYVINPFCEDCMPRDERIINFITWLGYVNSCLNPVIYTIFNVEFRRAFVKLLRCSNNMG